MAKAKKADLTKQLLKFMGASPTPFHAVREATQALEKAGFRRTVLGKGTPKKGQFYFTTNDSALVAVSLGAPLEKGFRILGAHTDSPCLRLKPNAAYVEKGCLQLGVEVYGGALLNPWFDRDLSLAGRVTGRNKSGEIVSVLLDFKRPLATIPSLAIHLDRGVNEKRSINAQKHLPPVLALVDAETGADAEPDAAADLAALLIKQAQSEQGVALEKVLGFELSLYDTQPPAVLGLHEDFIASARLDNLLSAYVCTKVAAAHSAKSNCVVVLSDHEEVGSRSHSGAAGPLLEAVLRKLCGSETAYRASLDHSMMVSVDNAHALHPNYAALHEPRHQPAINAGPVIKVNHEQRYATNSETQAVFAAACEAVGVPYQQFVVRSDLGCGSTIGPITATGLGVRTLDVGVPQWAMHSIREQAGVKDVAYLKTALDYFVALRALP